MNEIEAECVFNSTNTKDILKFPQSDAVLFQYDYSIKIRRGMEYDISIPVNLDEYIVSLNFADTHTQKVWQDELNNISH